MGDLGLNNVHEEEVRKFLKFARYNRTQQLRSVEGSFQDIRDSRLHEDTFTVDEVEEMLNGLQAIVKGSVETELLNAAHTNVLLLVQLFTQAEKWHLKLQSDISELENQKLLKEIAEFEEEELAGVKKKKGLDTLSLTQKKLEPLNEGGSTALLQMEINRLIEENENLKKKVETLEKSTNSTLEEKSKLKQDLENAQRLASNRKPSPTIVQSNPVQPRPVSPAENEYKEKYDSVEEELTSTKHRILELQHELEVMNEELDKKFSETTQYRNMKKMLEGKNGQMKELRNRLKKYEPDCEL